MTNGGTYPYSMHSTSNSTVIPMDADDSTIATGTTSSRDSNNSYTYEKLLSSSSSPIPIVLGMKTTRGKEDNDSGDTISQLNQQRRDTTRRRPVSKILFGHLQVSVKNEPTNVHMNSSLTAAISLASPTLEPITPLLLNSTTTTNNNTSSTGHHHSHSNNLLEYHENSR